MKLTDAALNAYIDAVLFFGPDEKSRYEDQIEHLKTTLINAIHDNSELGVSGINQAGSWRKGTALNPGGGQDIDIDLVVYLEVEEAGAGDIKRLHNLVLELLRKAYPTKNEEDFRPGKKTIAIEFHTSGLKVDLAPAVPVKGLDTYVWQPEVGGGGTFQTSPKGQLEFIQNCKKQDPRFTQVVRLAKRWRNYAELQDELSSFTIELLVAHINARQGGPQSIEDGFRRFLLYVAQSELREVITFPGAIRKTPSSTAPVRIYDPTNNENNVTSRMTDSERLTVVRKAEDDYQAINHARSIERKGETEALWKQVLGPQFFL